MPPTTTTIALSAVAGLAAGYLLTSPPSPPTPPPRIAPTAATAPQARPTPRTPLHAESLDFLDQLSAATTAELPAILSHLFAEWNQNHGEYYHLHLGPLTERWVSLDPEGAVRHAYSINQTYLAKQMFHAWTRFDPEAALQAANSWEPGDQRPRLLSGVLEILAETDPTTFRARVLEGISPDQEISARALHTVVADLARSDFEAALEFVAALPRSNQQGARGTVAATFARTNPAAATAWARSLTNHDQHDHALGHIARTLAEGDPAAARDLLVHFHADRKFPASAIAQKLAESDPAKALDWILTIDRKGTPNSAAQLFVRDLAQQDPHAAFANLQRILDTIPPGDHSLYTTATSNFHNFDPQVLPGLAAGITPDTNPAAIAAAIAAIALAWTNHDATAAVAWLAETLPSLPDARTRSKLTASILARSRSIEPAALPGIANQLGSLAPHLTPDTAKDLARQLSRSDDPAVASAYFSNIASAFPAEQTASTGHERVNDPSSSQVVRPDSLLAAFVFPRFRRLTQADPAAAVAEASTLTDPQQRRLAFNATAANWVAYSPQAASTWASNLPDGTDRDHAAAGISGIIAKSDPGAALTWAAAIGDPGLRNITATRAIDDIPADALTSTAELIPDLDISPGEQTALLTAIESRLDKSK